MLNIFLFVSTFIAYFVRGITGFGNTLVMGSLFSFVIANRVTTPVDLVFSIPTNMFMVWHERKSISLKIVVPLSLMLLAGVIPGTFLLKFGNDWILKAFLGLVVVGVALEMHTRKPVQDGAKKGNPVLLVIIGVASGILSGLFGIGALLVAYISRTTAGRSEFRANICCVFLVENIFRFFLYWYTGILQKDILLFCLFLIPAVILGMVAGVKIDKRMNDETVKKTTVALLVVSGTVLFLKSVLYH